MSLNLKTLAGSLMAVGCLYAGSAQADFSGPYSIANSTRVLNGGIVNTGGAPSSIFLRSANGGAAANTTISWTAAVAGAVRFDWAYSTQETAGGRGANTDPVSFFVNGGNVGTFATNGAKTGGGLGQTFAVAAGDTFGFRIRTTDGNGLRGRLDISNFSGPVPEPETYLLMGLGAFGLAYARRRQQKNKDQQDPPLVGPA